MNQSRVGLKDYIAGLTPEEKTERDRKTSKGASRRSRPLVAVFMTRSRVGLNEYWKSKEGVERREYQRTDEYLAQQREKGFVVPQDGEKISAGAPRRSGGIAVLWRLHAIDARRLQERRSWVVSFSILRPFGPTSSLLDLA